MTENELLWWYIGCPVGIVIGFVLAVILGMIK